MLHISKVKPMFTNLVTTGDRFEKDLTSNGIILAYKGDLKPWQTVTAIGSAVRDIKVGDKVMIDFANYLVRKYSKDSIQNDMDNNPKVRYDLHWVTVDDDEGRPQEWLLLSDRDIQYVFEGGGERRPDNTGDETRVHRVNRKIP